MDFSSLICAQNTSVPPRRPQTPLRKARFVETADQPQTSLVDKDVRDVFLASSKAVENCRGQFENFRQTTSASSKTALNNPPGRADSDGLSREGARDKEVEIGHEPPTSVKQPTCGACKKAVYMPCWYCVECETGEFHKIIRAIPISDKGDNFNID